MPTTSKEWRCYHACRTAFFDRPWGAVALIATVGTAASCDKIALVAPTDAIITISTSRTVLPLNGTAEIRAVSSN